MGKPWVRLGRSTLTLILVASGAGIEPAFLPDQAKASIRAGGLKVGGQRCGHAKTETGTELMKKVQFLNQSSGTGRSRNDPLWNGRGQGRRFD
jgi:hypothetical protein